MASVIAKSPELAAIQENTELLIDCIARDVDAITNVLISKFLITEGLRETLRLPSLEPSNKSGRIVDHITGIIRSDPSKFELFVSILEARGESMKECVEEVKHCYETNKAAAVQRASEDSDKPSFKCPFCQKCSLEEYCKHGCPNASGSTELVQPQFPFLDTLQLDEKEKEILEMKLTDDFEKIEEAFGDFCISLSSSQFPVHDIVLFLLSKSMFTSAGVLSEELAKATSMVDILIVLCGQHVSFFNYEILEKIVNKFGSSKDKENLQAYLAEFQEYCKHNVFEIPYSKFKKSKDSQKDVCNFALKYTEEKPITVGQLKTVCRNIAKILKLDPWTLQLLSIEDGCIVLNIIIPQAVAKNIFPLSKSQEEALETIGLRQHQAEETEVQR